MKKLFILAAACAFAFVAISDTVTVTVSAAGAAAYSDPINISGYLDRVELVKSSDNDVVDIDLATWSGTTAVDTYVNIDALATATDVVVIRPRVLGTGASGTTLTAATDIVSTTDDSTNAVTTTILAAPYERPLVGGNIKLKVGASAGTNATVTATLYYERLAR
jgi:hypothetical protein